MRLKSVNECHEGESMNVSDSIKPNIDMKQNSRLQRATELQIRVRFALIACVSLELQIRVRFRV